MAVTYNERPDTVTAISPPPESGTPLAEDIYDTDTPALLALTMACAAAPPVAGGLLSLILQRIAPEASLFRTRRWQERFLFNYHQSIKPPSQDPSAGTRTEPAPRLLLEPVRERLGQISQLERDWDSYGAEPISHRATAVAGQLLQSVQEWYADLVGEQVRPYAVAPLPTGGVQLEWRGSRAVLEVEVGPQGDLGYLLIEGEDPDRSFTEDDNVRSSEIRGLLGRLLVF